MGEPDDPFPRTEVAKLSPGRIRALSMFARVEFAVAALLAIGVCVGRITVFTSDSTPLWAALGIIVTPSYIMATVLTIAHARQVRRPLPTVWPELAFWAVGPVAAVILLAVTAIASR